MLLVPETTTKFVHRHFSSNEMEKGSLACVVGKKAFVVTHTVACQSTVVHTSVQDRMRW